MYGDVNVAVVDGNLGASSNGTGIHVKIGVSQVASDVPILIVNTMSPEKIKEKLGNSPLADACIDSCENGAKTIYCIPVQAGVQATVGQIKHEGTGTGTVTVSGSPQNNYDVILKIIDSGNTNEAVFVYSIDGGTNFSEEMTIPLSGEYDIANTGLKLNFADDEIVGDEGDSFVANDSYVFSTTAPQMMNAEVLKALEKLINFSVDFEFVHIVGATDKSCWASVSAFATELQLTYKKPTAFILEARKMNNDETLDEYYAAMEQERKGIANYLVQVVLTYGTYQRKDGRVQDINMAGVLCGFYSRARQSQSIGEVARFPISEAKLLKLLPAGVEDFTEAFDSLKFTTIRRYMGKENYFVSNAKMMCSDTSDFRYMEDVRVLNRLVKDVRKQALESLQKEIDPGEIEAATSIIEKELGIPIDSMIKEGIISSGEAKIDTENMNILRDESFDVSVTYVPMGHVREINITFAVTNPQA